MSIADAQKVRQLEEKVLGLEQRLEAVVHRLNELESKPRTETVLMQGSTPSAKRSKDCPKCGEPGKGFFFHVRSCKGPKE